MCVTVVSDVTNLKGARHAPYSIPKRGVIVYTPDIIASISQRFSLLSPFFSPHSPAGIHTWWELHTA